MVILFGARFIPVCTGNITQEAFKNRVTPVYPCVHREHDCLRLWGCNLFGFIPVCTGNINGNLSQYGKISVYPCVHREHAFASCISESSIGLSLCAQGTYENYIIKNGYYRFIPVCTGNIRTMINRLHCLPVYPCVHREHIKSMPILILLSGLSLCAQGTYQL